MSAQRTLKANERVRRVHTLKHRNGKFVVDEWEPRNASGATPILLIHGWGGSGSYWKQTAHFLSKTTRVFVPDLMGTGRSMPIERTHTMQDQVATLAYLLDQFELDSVQIVSHSMGGAMALLLAELVPQKIERIVLTSLCFFTSERQVQIYTNVMQVYRLTMLFRPKILAEIPPLRYAAATRFFHKVPNDSEQLRQGLLDYLEMDGPTAMACAADVATAEIPEAAARLQVPVLLVVCRNDQVTPVDNVDYTAATIPDCRVVWIDQCGHLPMVEKSAEYFEILESFVAL